MAFTHRVEYTKNMLEGELQGSQLSSSFEVRSASLAAKWAILLATGGVHRDAWTGAAYTAHNVRIVPIEVELPGLVEHGGRGWDAYDQADAAYDLAIEATL